MTRAMLFLLALVTTAHAEVRWHCDGGTCALWNDTQAMEAPEFRLDGATTGAMTLSSFTSFEPITWPIREFIRVAPTNEHGAPVSLDVLQATALRGDDGRPIPLLVMPGELTITVENDGSLTVRTTGKRRRVRVRHVRESAR